MMMKKSPTDCPAMSRALKHIETQNDANVDRGRLHLEIEDLQRTIDEVADPLLKKEYHRRLALLRGSN